MILYRFILTYLGLLGWTRLNSARYFFLLRMGCVTMWKRVGSPDVKFDRIPRLPVPFKWAGSKINGATWVLRARNP